MSTRNHYDFAIREGYTAEEALAGVHRFARDSSRTPMQWDDTANAGFTAGTPWLPVSDDYAWVNAASEKNDPDSVLNWYISLAGLRREHPALTAGDYTELFPEDENIFAYTREADGEKAVILINFSTETVSYDPACLEGAELMLSSVGANTVLAMRSHARQNTLPPRKQAGIIQMGLFVPKRCFTKWGTAMPTKEMGPA